MSFPTPYQTPIRKNTQSLTNSPETKIDNQPSQEFSTLILRQVSQNPIEVISFTQNSQVEPSSLFIESSDLPHLRHQSRNPERISTVILTSESIISRNRLQECSVHIERLIEHSNTLSQSKKFEDKIQIREIPGLHSPVFANSPTIAFCNRCGRDVRTKVRRASNSVFGVNILEYFCCFPGIEKQEIIHSCSRCKKELVKVTL